MNTTLTKDEKDIIAALLADPEKRYQLLALFERELHQFGEWREKERLKALQDEKDQKNVSFLRKLISKFH